MKTLNIRRAADMMNGSHEVSYYRLTFLPELSQTFRRIDHDHDTRHERQVEGWHAPPTKLVLRCTVATSPVSACVPSLRRLRRADRAIRRVPASLSSVKSEASVLSSTRVNESGP
jgi:hypothetical protein